MNYSLIVEGLGKDVLGLNCLRNMILKLKLEAAAA